MKAFAKEYQRGRKKDKGAIFDGFVEATGYQRRYAARLLRHSGRRVWVGRGVVVEADIRCRVPRRRRIDDGEVQRALKEIWQLLDYLCGNRLVAALEPTLIALERHSELKLSGEVREELLRISAGTIERLLAPEKRKLRLRQRGGTKPGTLLRHQVAVRTFADWDEARPGFVGYARYDTPAEVELLNQLYEQLRLCVNFFLPSQKLQEKVRRGSRVAKRYSPARTPYQRVLESVENLGQLEATTESAIPTTEPSSAAPGDRSVAGKTVGSDGEKAKRSGTVHRPYHYGSHLRYFLVEATNPLLGTFLLEATGRRSDPIAPLAPSSPIGPTGPFLGMKRGESWWGDPDFRHIAWHTDLESGGLGQAVVQTDEWQTRRLLVGSCSPIPHRRAKPCHLRRL